VAPIGAIPLASGPLDRADDGVFFFRPDGQDEGFLRRYLPEGRFDAAIVAARLLAPHPIGSIERKNGRRGDELGWVLEENSTPWILDPDTPELARSCRNDLPAKRLGMMPHAELYEPPWDSGLLSAPASREAIARNALAVAARSFAAPAVYFEASSLTDPWLDINLGFVEEAAKWAAGRPVSAFVQMPLEALLDGSLAAAAERYRQAGARIAMLRVTKFDPDRCSGDEARAYVDCVRTWRAAGLLPVADCTGRFGGALICVGAWA
jgi:hypothetical protein